MRFLTGVVQRRFVDGSVTNPVTAFARRRAAGMLSYSGFCGTKSVAPVQALAASRAFTTPTNNGLAPIPQHCDARHVPAVSIARDCIRGRIDARNGNRAIPSNRCQRDGREDTSRRRFFGVTFLSYFIGEQAMPRALISGNTLYSQRSGVVRMRQLPAIRD